MPATRYTITHITHIVFGAAVLYSMFLFLFLCDDRRSREHVKTCAPASHHVKNLPARFRKTVSHKRKQGGQNRTENTAAVVGSFWVSYLCRLGCMLFLCCRICYAVSLRLSSASRIGQRHNIQQWPANKHKRDATLLLCVDVTMFWAERDAKDTPQTAERRTDYSIPLFH